MRGRLGRAAVGRVVRLACRTYASAATSCEKLRTSTPVAPPAAATVDAAAVGRTKQQGPGRDKPAKGCREDPRLLLSYVFRARKARGMSEHTGTKAAAVAYLMTLVELTR